MTLPIVPGPFSFLAGAGEALGDIGQLREQRKERAQQIAERGTSKILDMLLQGADPSLLDDPNVQGMFKTAGYPVLSSKVARLMGAGEREKGREAEALGAAGYAPAAAQAATAGAQLTGETAEAKLGAGVPALQAEADAAEAQTKTAGMQFDRDRYLMARYLFGTDPKFARRAVDAATGVQDLYLRQLSERRAELTFEQAQLHDRALALREVAEAANREYRERLEKYEKDIVQAIELSGKTADPATIETWKANNPFPDLETFLTKYVKAHTGYSLEEFQQRNREVWDKLLPGGSGAPAKPTIEEPKTKVQKAIAAFGEKDVTPEDAGESLAFHESQGDLVDEERAQIIAMLRQKMPAEWFRKFQRSYKSKAKELTPDMPSP